MTFRRLSPTKLRPTGGLMTTFAHSIPPTTSSTLLSVTKFLPTANISPIFYLPCRTFKKAVESANLQNNIKVSTTHASSVLGNSFPPSAEEFGNDVKDTMNLIHNFLAQKGSPFMANVYPYFSYNGNRGSVNLDYALFNPSAPVVTDADWSYKNLVDSLIVAMEKLGQPNIAIVITESGWPSAGNDVATVANAQTYNNNLIKHVLSNDGTPRRPGSSIDTCIFALFNENLKGNGDGDPKRHFGLFNADKSRVYSELSMQPSREFHEQAIRPVKSFTRVF
eukprot:Gb_30254 [translate_table: standard]